MLCIGQSALEVLTWPQSAVSSMNQDPLVVKLLRGIYVRAKAPSLVTDPLVVRQAVSQALNDVPEYQGVPIWNVEHRWWVHIGAFVYRTDEASR